MDCTTEYENASDAGECSDSVLHLAINEVVSATATNGSRLYCPFCVATCESKASLFEHLKASHSGFVARIAGTSLLYDKCPFCDANHVGTHTVARHVLRFHSRLVAQLYLEIGDHDDDAAARSKCFFCSERFGKSVASDFASHVEDAHFLAFVELVVERFASSSEALDARNGVFKTSRKPAINCFDFASMREELCEVNGGRRRRNVEEDSILKYKKVKLSAPSVSEKAKVCRVLRFDVPQEDKENSVLARNINSSKQITFAEHSLLCRDNDKEQLHLLTFAKPLHSSTPKDKASRQPCESPPPPPPVRSKCGKKKATFKSYLARRDATYQCGKCKRMFQDDADLVIHVKRTHKIFIFNLVHPCYQCAICKAKFFKNRYLKKHMDQHCAASRELM